MMELQVGVKALLQNGEGRFLLLKRSEKYPNDTIKWDIPGGRIDPGTPLLENLAREVREETGLAVQGEPKLAAAQDILRVPGRHVVRLTYTARADGTPTLSEEHTAFRWVTRSELAQLTEQELDIYVKALLDAGVL